MITVTIGNQTGFVPKTAFDVLGDHILGFIETAEHQTLVVAGEIAYASSSGNATTEMLSTPVDAGGFGHPYGHGPNGTAGPRGPIPNDGDPGIINVQTGEFLEGWKETPDNFNKRDFMVQRLSNDTQHAKNLENTPDGLQIRRPIVERIEHLLEPIREANLKDALAAINRL
jgi:hypothetical protein